MANGDLLTLDAATDEMVQIDPSTGAVIGAIPLTLAGSPFDLRNITDIAESREGTLIVSDSNSYYSLDRNTGALSLVYEDVELQEGYLPGAAGLAFSMDAPDPDTLFMYDVYASEDIYTYATDAGWTRSLLYHDIIGEYNAGRGDLAALPVPEPAGVFMLAIGCIGLLARHKRR